MFALPPALSYSPLQGSEIRLIKFDNAFRHTEGFSCQLEHVKLNDNPVYFALSYVWGDATKTKRIIVNGHSFQVTFHSMLVAELNAGPRSQSSSISLLIKTASSGRYEPVL
jgi:hypothetical protein